MTARRSPAAPACSATGSWSEITARPGETFLDRMISLVEGADRQKTPNEIALSILLAGLTIIFLLAVVTLQPFAHLLGRRAVGHRARRPARVPHPDHDRRAAVGDRHRRDGPPGAAQRARDVGPRRRGRRRRDDAAARQDRHDHVRIASGRRVHPGPRRDRDRRRGGGTRLVARRRDPGGALDRRARHEPLRAGADGRDRRGARAVHRPDPDVGHGPRRRPLGPQGRRRLGSPLRAGAGRDGAARARARSSSRCRTTARLRSS